MNKQKICIICEGFEEKDYMEKLKTLNVFSNKYEILFINAKGITKIFKKYQEKYTSQNYYAVLIFCDTDDLTHYKDLKEKLIAFHGKDLSEDILYFGSPCTMQIILSHFDKVSLQSESKVANRDLINKLTKIPNYDATDEQRKELFSKIKQSNYKKMKSNIKDLSEKDTLIPATNFLKLLDNLENDNINWIKKINDKL